MLNSKPLSSLSTEELARALKSLNLNVGPITSSTRKIYENRLKEHLLKTIESNPSNEKPNNYVSKTLEEDNFQTNINSNNDFLNKTDIPDTEISNGESKPQNFYAVWTPISSKTENGVKIPNIYTSQQNALAFMKENRGSRFKLFKSIEEAEHFSLSKLDKPNVEKVVSSNRVNSVDSKIVFKSPTFHELLKFKKYIEEGNFLEVQKCLCNPRYLITSLDMPVILQEGCRYNPMHVAVHANKPNICKYFIELLHSHKFLKLVFSDESDDLNFREKQLVDIFLNTPDKACCDTPLHTACKFCFKEIVVFLLTCKETDLKSINKDGFTAFQVIGHRINSQSPLIRDIRELFEEKAYIPLYKNDFNPCVGQPIVTILPIDEDFSAEKIKAYVGPVAPAKAIQVFTVWKTQRKSPVALSDIDKGLERIGRDIADKENVPFTEYWTFLNGFYNLATKKGLEKLEEYLNFKSENSINQSEMSSYELKTSEKFLEKNETNLKDNIKRKLTFEDEISDNKHFEEDFDNSYNESLEHNDCSIDLDFKDLSVLFKTFTKRNIEPNISTNENELNQDKLPSPVEKPVNNSYKNVKKKSQKVFIDGDIPTKVDLDVFRAIKDVVIEPLQYPNIHHWKSYIESYSDTSKLSWPSPCSPRYHKYKKRTALPSVEDRDNGF
ncbi:ankyrin repeat and LEM domain-containing protein 2 isoform X1 [Hydra vulgaris]|uniref:ankyrin repeat and LEM domain-containing protein 2 isoform X1 n=1 Tax=Hydra vulgaris TaxID=6087 RepID=UPI001F5FB22E|nr:ankyrin repeat and LEM domain-containing protein 2 [Hydra vulgaris]